MTKKTTHIVNKLGLHARPAAMLVTAASKFQSEVYFTKEDLKVNGKSIMGVMMLAAERGVEIIVEASGPDETEAVDACIHVIETGFGEEI